MALRLRNYHLARVGLIVVRSTSKVKSPNLSSNCQRQNLCAARENSPPILNSNGNFSLYRRFMNIIKSPRRSFCEKRDEQVLDENAFEIMVDDTLESLCDKFEDTLERFEDLDSDVSLSVSVKPQFKPLNLMCF